MTSSAAATLVEAGDGVSDALELASRASTLELPPGTRDPMGPDAWIAFLPAFAAWAEGRVTDAAALLDRFEGVTLSSDGHAFRLGKMNLALGRVQAAERAFQQMSVVTEREAFLGYAAFARGDATARLFERRGDRYSAAAALRRLDVVQRAVYAVSGMHGFEWLLARAHLLALERRLGRVDSAAAIARDLEGWLAVADSDFVIRASLP